MRFPIVIYKDAGSDYGVTVPDLPGCFSAGTTIDEARSNAVEAIECHLEGMLMDGLPLSSMHEVEHHRSDERFPDGIQVFVEVDVTKLSSPGQPHLKVSPS